MPSATLRRLLDQRATAWSQVQDIQARRSAAGYESTSEDGETYTRALDDVDRLSQEIETEERAEQLGRLFDAPADDHRSTNPRPGAEDENRSEPSDEYREAFDLFLRHGMEAVPMQQRSLLNSGFVATNESRALGAGTTTAGGYTVPVDFWARMVETMKAYGGILSEAEILNTADGAPIQWTTNDDTANMGALLSENTQVTEQDLTFGTAALGAYMYTSKLVRVSLQLLQDSAFDLNTWLPRKLGERIARALSVHLASGNGTSQPQGLVTGLLSGATSASGTAISYDDLVNLEFSLDPAYRNSPNLRYVFSDSAIKSLRKVKDSTGRPLWAPSITAGVPSTINGHPYSVDNNMDVLGVNSKSVVFGDIRAAYLVRQVQGAQTMRLTERYADFLQVGFLGFARYDAKVQDTGAAKLLTQAAT